MSEIKKGDTVEYSLANGETFIARVDHLYEYPQGQGPEFSPGRPSERNQDLA